MLFAVLGSVVSCAKKVYVSESNCTAVPTGDTVIYLRDQQIALFAPCIKQVRSTLRDVMDSRCPKGVNCVWAGTAKVQLRLDEAFDITLEINKQKDTTYNSHRYSFTLVDVLPYPGTSADAPKAIIRIVEK